LRDNEAIVIDFDDDGFAGCHYISRFVEDDSVSPRRGLSWSRLLEIDGYVFSIDSDGDHFSFQQAS